MSCSGGDATRAWVAWLGGERKKLVFTLSSSLEVAPVCSLQCSTLNLENLRCGFECGYNLPRLFSPSFFLANSKLHFYSLLLQKTTFTGLKAKDLYRSHPYLKDIIRLLEQTHLWASVHISTHVAVIYPSMRPNKRLIITSQPKP